MSFEPQAADSRKRWRANLKLENEEEELDEKKNYRTIGTARKAKTSLITHHVVIMKESEKFLQTAETVRQAY